MPIIQELDFRNLYPKNSYACRFNSDLLGTNSLRCQISLNVNYLCDTHYIIDRKLLTLFARF